MTIFKRPYVFWLAGLFVLYLALAVLLSEFYVTVQYIPYYVGQIHWIELGLSVLFTIIIAFLVAYNAVNLYCLYKKRKTLSKKTGISCIAAFGGLAVGVCPICATGLLPLVLGSVGVAFTWAALPFKGLEMQIIVIALLAASGAHRKG